MERLRRRASRASSLLQRLIVARRSVLYSILALLLILTSAVVTAATAPGVPTGVSGVRGNGQVIVNFTAPASDGGSAITSYTVTASPGGATATGAASPIVVTGLTNGTAYTFTVNATNAVGTGPSSVASFATKTDFVTGTNPFAVAIGDLNGDGKLDVVTANFGAGVNTVSVLLNTTAVGATTQTFAARADFVTGVGPRSVAIGDVNGDGKPDLVIGDFTENLVSVLLNTTATGASTPTFAAKVDFPTGFDPASVVLVDLNADGKLDIATANSNGIIAGQAPDETRNTISVLLNTTATNATTPTFGAKSDFYVGTGPSSIAAGVLTSNLGLDLVIANEGSGTVSIYPNTTAPGATTPTFGGIINFNTQSNPHSRSEM